VDGWGLRRAVSLPFAVAAAISSDPDHLARLHTYTSDMVRPFPAVRSGRPAPGRGQSYGEMARDAIGELLGDDETVDLLILAYDIPDVEPGRATTTYLSHVCPGNPLAFALCDQGTAAAFTGLRLAHEYARTGEARRILLLIAEQAELPYGCQAPVILPTGHAIVALLLAGAAPDGPLGRIDRVVNEPGVPPADLAGRLRRFTGDYEKPTVLLGSALDPSIVDGAYAAPAGQPATGVWTLLAEELSGDLSGTVVVADYDSRLGYFSAAAIRFG
jgi:4-hydroxymandelate oxidase